MGRQGNSRSVKAKQLVETNYLIKEINLNSFNILNTKQPSRNQYIESPLPIAIYLIV